MPRVNKLIRDFEFAHSQLVGAIAQDRLAEIEKLDQQIAGQFDHLISIDPYSNEDRDQLISFILDYLLPPSEQSPVRIKARNKVSQLAQMR